MESLPYLLAGPIVRRVEKEKIYIWVASSQKPNLKLELLHNGNIIDALFVEQPKFQLGKEASLWVTLLRLDAAEGQEFPIDQALNYQIYNNDSDTYLDLSDVTYAGEESPSFIIPSSLNAIAYGSCRKPHGFSQSDDDKFQKADSLALLGQNLQKNLHDYLQRPSTLCLMGDQIYADDVLDPVMDLLQEQIDLVFKEGVGSVFKQGNIKDNFGLSSTSQNKHLLSFCEYAAMYLFILGNRCELSADIKLESEKDIPKALQYLQKISPVVAGIFEDFTGLLEDSKSDYKKAERSLNGFIESLADVRKVFANISTYMIFDDHDVSDDWNITRLWYDNVRASPNGTRIVSNALATYWAFQGWGNDPDKFSKEFTDNIMDYLHDPQDKNKAQRFDFYLWKAHCWSYTIPTVPPILVLDSRTQRDFGGYNDPAKLLNRYGTDQLRGDWLKLNRYEAVKNTPLIIAPTPVFGYAPIEKLQKLAYLVGMFFGNQTGRFTSDYLDLESWVANKQGFSSFLNVLIRNLKLSKVVFLSGDVHYSFVHQGRFVAGKNELKYMQLTSTALRNTPKKPRFLSRLLSHKIKTKTQGPIYPEILPWWERIFYIWRLFKREYWTSEVECRSGCDKGKRLIGRTSRPNIGLVYFENGEISKQILLSGDDGEDSVFYDFN